MSAGDEVCCDACGSSRFEMIKYAPKRWFPRRQECLTAQCWRCDKPHAFPLGLVRCAADGGYNGHLYWVA